MRVELIYDADCPNAAAARENLREALVSDHARTDWTEWDRAAQENPPYVRRYGSPTILVDGQDVAGLPPSDGSASCRIYTSTTGEMGGIPPVETIAATLGKSHHRRSGLRGLLSVVPGVGASLLPVGVCPACVPGAEATRAQDA